MVKRNHKEHQQFVSFWMAIIFALSQAQPAAVAMEMLRPEAGAESGFIRLGLAAELLRSSGPEAVHALGQGNVIDWVSKVINAAQSDSRAFSLSEPIEAQMTNYAASYGRRFGEVLPDAKREQLAGAAQSIAALAKEAIEDGTELVLVVDELGTSPLLSDGVSNSLIHAALLLDTRKSASGSHRIYVSFEKYAAFLTQGQPGREALLADLHHRIADAKAGAHVPASEADQSRVNEALVKVQVLARKAAAEQRRLARLRQQVLHQQGAVIAGQKFVTDIFVPTADSGLTIAELFKKRADTAAYIDVAPDGKVALKPGYSITFEGFSMQRPSNEIIYAEQASLENTVRGGDKIIIYSEAGAVSLTPDQWGEIFTELAAPSELPIVAARDAVKIFEMIRQNSRGLSGGIPKTWSFAIAPGREIYSNFSVFDVVEHDVTGTRAFKGRASRFLGVLGTGEIELNSEGYPVSVRLAVPLLVSSLADSFAPKGTPTNRYLRSLIAAKWANRAGGYLFLVLSGRSNKSVPVAVTVMSQEVDWKAIGIEKPKNLLGLATLPFPGEHGSAQQSISADAFRQLLQQSLGDPGDIGVKVNLRHEFDAWINQEFVTQHRDELTAGVRALNNALLQQRRVGLEDGPSYIHLAGLDDFYLEQRDALILLAIGKLLGWWRLFPDPDNDNELYRRIYAADRYGMFPMIDVGTVDHQALGLPKPEQGAVTVASEEERLITLIQQVVDSARVNIRLTPLDDNKGGEITLVFPISEIASTRQPNNSLVHLISLLGELPAKEGQPLIAQVVVSGEEDLKITVRMGQHSFIVLQEALAERGAVTERLSIAERKQWVAGQLGTDKISYYKSVLIGGVIPVASLIINRPDQLNALNNNVLKVLNHRVYWMKYGNNKAFILTGAGTAFVAGADIQELYDQRQQGENVALTGQMVFRRIEEVNKPVISAINGATLGGGNELMLATDYRIAGRNAVFGQPEILLGIMPGYGGTQRLGWELGRLVAGLITLSGDTISADQALRIGLIDEVVDDPVARASKVAHGLISGALLLEALQQPRRERLMDLIRVADGVSIMSDPRIRQLVDQNIARGQGEAARRIVRAIDEGVTLSYEAGQDLEAQLFGEVMRTEEAKQGLSDFLAKKRRRAIAMPELLTVETLQRDLTERETELRQASSALESAGQKPETRAGELIELRQQEYAARARLRQAQNRLAAAPKAATLKDENQAYPADIAEIMRQGVGAAAPANVTSATAPASTRPISAEEAEELQARFADLGAPTIKPGERGAEQGLPRDFLTSFHRVIDTLQAFEDEGTIISFEKLDNGGKISLTSPAAFGYQADHWRLLLTILIKDAQASGIAVSDMSESEGRFSFHLLPGPLHYEQLARAADQAGAAKGLNKPTLTESQSDFARMIGYFRSLGYPATFNNGWIDLTANGGMATRYFQEFFDYLRTDWILSHPDAGIMIDRNPQVGDDGSTKFSFLPDAALGPALWEAIQSQRGAVREISPSEEALFVDYVRQVRAAGATVKVVLYSEGNGGGQLHITGTSDSVLDQQLAALMRFGQSLGMSGVSSNFSKYYLLLSPSHARLLAAVVRAELSQGQRGAARQSNQLRVHVPFFELKQYRSMLFAHALDLKAIASLDSAHSQDKSSYVIRASIVPTWQWNLTDSQINEAIQQLKVLGLLVPAYDDELPAAPTGEYVIAPEVFRIWQKKQDQLLDLIPLLPPGLPRARAALHADRLIIGSWASLYDALENITVVDDAARAQVAEALRIVSEADQRGAAAKKTKIDVQGELQSILEQFIRARGPTSIKFDNSYLLTGWQNYVTGFHTFRNLLDTFIERPQLSQATFDAIEALAMLKQRVLSEQGTVSAQQQQLVRDEIAGDVLELVRAGFLAKGEAAEFLSRNWEEFGGTPDGLARALEAVSMAEVAPQKPLSAQEEAEMLGNSQLGAAARKVKIDVQRELQGILEQLIRARGSTSIKFDHSYLLTGWQNYVTGFRTFRYLLDMFLIERSRASQATFDAIEALAMLKQRVLSEQGDGLARALEAVSMAEVAPLEAEIFEQAIIQQEPVIKFQVPTPYLGSLIRRTLAHTLYLYDVFRPYIFLEGGKGFLKPDYNLRVVRKGKDVHVPYDGIILTNDEIQVFVRNERGAAARKVKIDVQRELQGILTQFVHASGPISDELRHDLLEHWQDYVTGGDTFFGIILTFEMNRTPLMWSPQMSEIVEALAMLKQRVLSEQGAVSAQQQQLVRDEITGDVLEFVRAGFLAKSEAEAFLSRRWEEFGGTPRGLARALEAVSMAEVAPQKPLSAQEEADLLDGNERGAANQPKLTGDQIEFVRWLQWFRDQLGYQVVFINGWIDLFAEGEFHSGWIKDFFDWMSSHPDLRISIPRVPEVAADGTTKYSFLPDAALGPALWEAIQTQRGAVRLSRDQWLVVHEALAQEQRNGNYPLVPMHWQAAQVLLGEAISRNGNSGNVGILLAVDSTDQENSSVKLDSSATLPHLGRQRAAAIAVVRVENSALKSVTLRLPHFRLGQNRLVRLSSQASGIQFNRSRGQQVRIEAASAYEYAVRSARYLRLVVDDDNLPMHVRFNRADRKALKLGSPKTVADWANLPLLTEVGAARRSQQLRVHAPEFELNQYRSLLFAHALDIFAQAIIAGASDNEPNLVVSGATAPKWGWDITDAQIEQALKELTALGLLEPAKAAGNYVVVPHVVALFMQQEQLRSRTSVYGIANELDLLSPNQARQFAAARNATYWVPFYDVLEQITVIDEAAKAQVAYALEIISGSQAGAVKAQPLMVFEVQGRRTMESLMHDRGEFADYVQISNGRAVLKPEFRMDAVRTVPTDNEGETSLLRIPDPNRLKSRQNAETADGLMLREGDRVEIYTAAHRKMDFDLLWNLLDAMKQAAMLGKPRGAGFEIREANYGPKLHISGHSRSLLPGMFSRIRQRASGRVLPETEPGSLNIGLTILLTNEEAAFLQHKTEEGAAWAEGRAKEVVENMLLEPGAAELSIHRSAVREAARGQAGFVQQTALPSVAEINPRAPRWLILSSASFTETPTAPEELRRILSETNALLDGGESPLRIGLIIEKTSDPEKADAEAVKLLAAMAEAPGGSQFTRQDFDLILPGSSSVPIDVAVNTFASGSSIGSFLGSKDFIAQSRASLANPQVQVAGVVYTPEASGSAAMDLAYAFSVDADGKLDPKVLGRLTESLDEATAVPVKEDAELEANRLAYAKSISKSRIAR